MYAIQGFTAQPKKYQKMSFIILKKAYLKRLPFKMYEVLDIQRRTVNAYAHISYKYNFYSVPRDYIG